MKKVLEPSLLSKVDASKLIEAVKKASSILLETFGIGEVAKFLNVHPQTARRWLKKGILPPPVVKVGRIVRWSRAQLEKFIAEGVQG